MSDPGGRNAWLTPENLPSGTRTLTVPVPDDLEWIAIFKGAVALLTNADNFQEFGALSPVDVAQEFMEMFLAIGEDMMPIGTILEFSGVDLPDKFLWADGSPVLIADYEELYMVIGDRFHPGGISAPEYFYLPDKRGRVSVGLDISQSEFLPLGRKGGAKTVTLTVGQLPSHYHNQQSNTMINGGSGYPKFSAAGESSMQGGITGNTGGGQAHENLQPYLVTNFIIRALK